VEKERSTRGVADTGCNQSICPQWLADKYHIPIQPCKRKTVITFGKETASSEVIGYAYFGELLGDIAIVEDASDILIQMDHFTDRGMEVLFMDGLFQIWHSQSGACIYQGQQEENSLS
jgi:hypothetical protein